MLRALPSKILSRVSRKFLDPHELLAEAKVSSGDKVLELGSPIGYFAAAALREVGDSGSVYVAGPSNDSLEAVSHFSHHENLHPVLLRDVLLGKTVPLHLIDTVILTNLLSSSLHPGEFCMSINQFLKPTSQVILVDWDSEIREVGPDPAQRVSREQAVKLMAQCGMEFERVLKTPGYHYGLVFRASGHEPQNNDNLES